MRWRALEARKEFKRKYRKCLMYKLRMRRLLCRLVMKKLLLFLVKTILKN